MKLITLLRLFFSVLLTFALGTALVAFSQKEFAKFGTQILSPRLVESISVFKSDQSSMIIDTWRNEISKESGSVGAIIVYCGQPCKYGEIEAHLRGIEFALDSKKMDPTSYTIMYSINRISNP